MNVECSLLDPPEADWTFIFIADHGTTWNPANSKCLSKEKTRFIFSRFIKHKVAGDAVFAVRTQLLPDSHGAAMMLIVAEVACQECPGALSDWAGGPAGDR